MKSLVSLALILLVSQVTLSAKPADKIAKGALPRAHAVKKSQLGTSFRLDGSSLRGKHQSSMNTAATVENDKLLDDLLKGRTQFEDRSAKESERN